MRDCGTGGGSIILASSAAGLIARPGMTAYGCSKQALRSLVMYGAAELGQYGIRVNTIHPCGVNSPMFLECWSEDKIKEMLAALPLGRLAEADDIAAMVTFLASNDAQFLTGGAFKVDGGQANY
jgi:NAD(P)-dependent dehydrogenase (short-subunit alcohol dehydrogenase family)